MSDQLAPRRGVGVDHDLFYASLHKDQSQQAFKNSLFDVQVIDFTIYLLLHHPLDQYPVWDHQDPKFDFLVDPIDSFGQFFPFATTATTWWIAKQVIHFKHP